MSQCDIIRTKKSVSESKENNKELFGQLGELTSILFEDFRLSIGLSRDPRKNLGEGGRGRWGRSLFSRGP